jgi:hypothetical protein
MPRHGDNLHESLIRDHSVAGPSDRGFGLVFAGFFVALTALSIWKGSDSWHWWLPAAVLFALVAVVVPYVLRPLNWLWTRFGLLLHRIMNPVVMGIIFFGVVAPMGLLMRLLKRRPLLLDYDAKASTYWISRSKPEAGSMTRQF